MNTYDAQSKHERPVGDLVPFESWLASLSRSKTSGWRYRKQGLISTVEIMGRIFVSRDAILEFERRAAAGEFAKRHGLHNQPSHENLSSRNEGAAAL